jgi:serine/threonine protein kinase
MFSPSRSSRSPRRSTTSVSGSTHGYNLVKKLNEGVYGVVNLVEKNGEKFAEKVYKRKPDVNEIDILTRFRHPNLLHAVEVFYESPDLHLILPYAPYSMKSYLRQHGGMNLEKTATFAHKLLSACAFMHDNRFFHCDIKPDNILMMDKDTPLLADFGLSFEDGIQWSGSVCGTPTYGSLQTTMIGESKDSAKWDGVLRVIREEEPDRIQSDIHAMGAVMYECFTGKKLFPHALRTEDELAKVHRFIDGNLQRKMQEVLRKSPESEHNDIMRFFQIIRKCCKLSQRYRFQTISEILEDPFFVRRGLNHAIPGRVDRVDMEALHITGWAMMPTRPFETWCEASLVWMLKTFHHLATNSPLHVICQTIQLFYRLTPLVRHSSMVQKYLCTSIYMAERLINSSNSYGYPEIEYQSSGQVSADELKECEKQSIGYLKGEIRASSICEWTDDASMILFWIFKCINDITYCTVPLVEVENDYMNQHVGVYVDLMDVVRVLKKDDDEKLVALLLKDRRVVEVRFDDVSQRIRVTYSV